MVIGTSLFAFANLGLATFAQPAEAGMRERLKKRAERSAERRAGRAIEYVLGLPEAILKQQKKAEEDAAKAAKKAAEEAARAAKKAPEEADKAEREWAKEIEREERQPGYVARLKDISTYAKDILFQAGVEQARADIASGRELRAGKNWHPKRAEGYKYVVEQRGGQTDQQSQWEVRAR
jgi:hypothetical protein